MKRKTLLLLPLFLGVCSGSGENPVIKIEKLYAKIGSNGKHSGPGEKDYTNQRGELPALEVGDEMKASLLSGGNEVELKTLKLQNDDKVDTKLFYEETEVSTEGDLADAEKGQLCFKDRVLKVKIMVIATIKQIDRNGDVKLEFYLSSKTEYEGVQEEIGSKMKVEDEKQK